MMKTRYLLLLAGIAFSSLSFAQDAPYRSYFGKEFTHWYVDNEMFDVARHSERYSVYNQDTLLNNGINYKKGYIFRSLKQNNPGYYYFGIREEIETGSLFVALANIYETTDYEVSEVLVSRMDMEIGDKYYFPPVREDFNKSYCWYCFNDVQRDEKGYFATVDSIYYKDNRKHIRFDANYHAVAHIYVIPLTFIEGIGPNVSFEPLIKDLGWPVCCNCYEDETGVWKSDIKSVDGSRDFSLFEECFFEITGIPEIEADFPFKLIQQKEKIEIQLNSVTLNHGIASIYSIDGKQLASEVFRNSSQVDFSVSEFPRGVYIILVRDVETGKGWSKKVSVK